MAAVDRTAAREDSTDVATLEAGLDALSLEERRTVRAGAKLRRTLLPPVVAVLALLGLWWVFVAAGVKPAYVVPGPADVWATLTQQWSEGVVQQAVFNSLTRGAVGFLAAVLLGTAVGVIVSRVGFVRVALGPLLSGLQSLPSVAWVPAAIIWFGLTDAAMYAVILLGAVPSIANGLVAGIDQVPPLFHRVGHVLGARGLAAVRLVVLPAALPGYLSGLKQGWAFSWRSLMAAELIVFSPELGPGLGQFLDTGRQLSDMSWVMAGILLILLVGISVELLVFAPLERRVLRARGLLVER
jgi:NitT/TauT family transport system permease protein